jgi:lipoprotein-releasing system ATP-binding protein
MIEAREVRKAYTMGRVTLEVLRGVSLRVEAGEFVAVMGPSGAGKSTLLHLLAGLDTPTGGTVLWEARPVSGLSDAKRAAFRNRMLGIVFQFYHLLPELSALENVCLPGLVSARSASGGSGGNGRALRARAASCLEQVGLSARVRHRPGELSGGEQQRVAIARALINKPKLLLCDEPTGNLDSKTGEGIIELLASLRKRDRVGLVLVTHEAALSRLADRTIVLEDGRIVKS